MSYLTSVANIKTYLGITSSAYDTKLAQILIAADSAVHQYCDRDSFFTNTYTNERYSGRAMGLNAGLVCLRNIPVNSIASITMHPDNSQVSTTYTGSSFTYESMTGMVQFSEGATNMQSFDLGFRNIAVTYGAGYTTIPDDLDAACAMVAAAMFNLSQTSAGMKSEKIGDYAYVSSRNNDGKNPWDIAFEDAAPILAKYRRTPAL